MKTLHIMNADLYNLGISPSGTKVGQIIVISSTLKPCPWKNNSDEVINPGNYKIVSRKSFRGGSQEIVKV